MSVTRIHHRGRLQGLVFCLVQVRRLHIAVATRSVRGRLPLLRKWGYRGQRSVWVSLGRRKGFCWRRLSRGCSLHVIFAEQTFMCFLGGWPPRIGDRQKAMFGRLRLALLNGARIWSSCAFRGFRGLPVGNGHGDKHQQRNHQSSRTDDHESVLLKLLLGTLFAPRCQIGPCSRGALGVWYGRHFWRHVSDTRRSAIAPVSLNHFLPPSSGATNVIGTRTGRSTSSACAI